MASDLTVGLDMIAAATVPTKPAARLLWGVVASTASPVQVVLENDTSATSRPVSGNASGPVAMGDRVLLARQRRRLTIVANPTAQARAMATLGALPRIATGTASITPTAANTPTSVAVTFPAGRFTATPIVVAIPHTSAPGTQVTGVGIGDRSASGCTIVGTRTSTTSFTVGWIAIQV